MSLTASARRGDRQTSHDAARSVNVPRSQDVVLRLLEAYGPCTDEVLSWAASILNPGISPSRLRTARHELEVAGKVRDTGRTDVLRSGRHAVVWALTDSPARASEGEAPARAGGTA
ncbi:MAG: hypothetical protein ACXV2H_09330 [Actinomycetes bacterium]